MKPFVLLATRAEELPATEEYALMLRFAGLAPNELRRIRLEAGPMPALDLDELSGIIVGGGPFNASDAPASKSAVQHRVEREMAGLLDEVVERDFPFLGACYGIGTLGTHVGATVDRAFGEPISVATIALTDEGRRDPLFGDLPPEFSAFVGHKEAISALPDHVVRLAGSERCPVQAFRVGRNVYATQFHPELDLEGITTRVHAYADHGYFAADELDLTLTAIRREPVVHTGRLLRDFVRRYAR